MAGMDLGRTEKGHRNYSHPCFYYISLTYLPRQTWRLYFRRRFMGLRGKSVKRGLDNFSQRRKHTAASSKEIKTRG
jgi:hypothetical protein